MGQSMGPAGGVGSHMRGKHLRAANRPTAAPQYRLEEQGDGRQGGRGLSSVAPASSWPLALERNTVVEV